LKKSEVIEHFGSVKAVADALSIKAPSVSEWKENIPLLRAYQLERITNGKLKAEEPELKKAS